MQVLLSNYDSAYTDAHVTVNHLPGVGRQYHYKRYLLDSGSNNKHVVPSLQTRFMR